MGYLGNSASPLTSGTCAAGIIPTCPVSAEEIAARDKNDDNSSYTIDAFFSACFLNQCLKHADTEGMANFSPTVNTRGLLFTILRALLRSRISCLNSMLSTCRTRWLITGLTVAQLAVSHKGKTAAMPIRRDGNSRLYKSEARHLAGQPPP